MNKEMTELNQLNVEQLTEKVEFFRRELFALRLNAGTTHIKDYSQFKKLRKNLARSLTYLHKKNNKNG